jgi:hypothetical protein
MSISATAKSKVYIGNPNPDISELAEFEAETWTEIKEVEDLGEWGAEAKELTFTSLADGHVRRRKGSIDSGVISLIVARDPNDDGQRKARAAVEELRPYSFKVELADKSSPGGQDTTFYFRAVVLSAQNKLGNADEITKTTLKLGIDGAILELLEVPIVTLTPGAGALSVAVHGVAYTKTIVAAGGVGTVAYHVTAGALPSGLTLNSATGVISGTPASAGSASFTITATYSGAGEEAESYTLVVA